MSPFNAELRRQIEGEFQTVRELNRKEAPIKLGVAQREKLKWQRKNSIMIENLTQRTKEHQEHGVHCELWIQRLASSNSFKNNSTAVNHLQWKKYARFSKLLDGKIKQVFSVVVGKLCLHCYMTLLKRSNNILKTHC
jgi:hypothetical protein